MCDVALHGENSPYYRCTLPTELRLCCATFDVAQIKLNAIWPAGDPVFPLTEHPRSQSLRCLSHWPAVGGRQYWSRRSEEMTEAERGDTTGPRSRPVKSEPELTVFFLIPQSHLVSPLAPSCGFVLKVLRCADLLFTQILLQVNVSKHSAP